jgi:hypothetical protein
MRTFTPQYVIVLAEKLKIIFLVFLSSHLNYDNVKLG